MPIYEYQCESCRKISAFLVRNIAAHTSPACPKCGSTSMRRVLSRVAVIGGRKGGSVRSAQDEATAASEHEGAGGAGEDLGAEDSSFPEPSPAEMRELESLLDSVDENDPRSMGRAMRRMAELAHEPIEGEMEEVIRRLEAGEDPDKIEEKMGDALGEGAGSGGDSGDELYDG